MKRIICQRAAHYERAAVGENDHAIAEHVPSEGLSRYCAGSRIPNSGLIIGVRGHISRSGNHENLAGPQQRNMNWIDRHGGRKGLPLSHEASLRKHLRCTQHKAEQRNDYCWSCIHTEWARGGVIE